VRLAAARAFLPRKPSEVLEGAASSAVIADTDGDGSAFLESPVAGAVLAPAAQVVLGTDNGGIHRGVYFAKLIEVRTDASVMFRAPQP
jgi:hypothetical protein